ncbi:hypothetical protein ACWEV3_40220 [Saccharopolyspora sp. NPDC003752]
MPTIPAAMEAGHGEYYVRLACATSPESPAFPAQIEDERWQEHARPWFRPEIAEAVIAWRTTHPEACTDCAQATVTLDDDTITLTDSTGISGPVEPDAQGRYGIGAGWWHWELTTPDTDPDTDAAILAEETRFAPQHGEQLVTIDIDGTDPAFPALLDDTTWNGWASPSFRKPVAEAVIAWLNTTAHTYPDGSQRGYWDGDTAICLDPNMVADDDYLPDHYEPGPDGRYSIGAWSWTWQTTER